jgi:hypothetical protein
MKRALIVLILTSWAGGCSYGLTTRELRLTASPRGVSTRIQTPSTEFQGELIEVQPSGLLILTSPGGNPTQKQDCVLRLVPFGAIRSSTFEQLGRRYDVSDGRPPQADTRERLRLVSRFPHGLAPALLQKLLESCGQTEVAGTQQ